MSETQVIEKKKEALSPAEKTKLEKLENVINTGKNTFVLVGIALTEIRDSRLYRAEYDTFEDYCSEKWGWKSSRARQLIAAASVVSDLSDEVLPEVTHEKIARKLVKVPKEKRVELIKAIKDTGKKVTTKTVGEAAKLIIDVDVVVKDAMGRQIPRSVIKYWDRNPEVQGLLTTLRKVKAKLQQARNDEDLMYVEVSESAIADLDKASTTIQCGKAYAVCPTCQGHPNTQPKGECRMCMGRGLISKFRWDHTVPEGTKKVIMATIAEERAKAKAKAIKAKAKAEAEEPKNGK